MSEGRQYYPSSTSFKKPRLAPALQQQQSQVGYGYDPKRTHIIKNVFGNSAKYNVDTAAQQQLPMYMFGDGMCVYKKEPLSVLPDIATIWKTLLKHAQTTNTNFDLCQIVPLDDRAFVAVFTSMPIKCDSVSMCDGRHGMRRLDMTPMKTVIVAPDDLTTTQFQLKVSFYSDKLRAYHNSLTTLINKHATCDTVCEITIDDVKQWGTSLFERIRKQLISHTPRTIAQTLSYQETSARVMAYVVFMLIIPSIFSMLSIALRCSFFTPNVNDDNHSASTFRQSWARLLDHVIMVHDMSTTVNQEVTQLLEFEFKWRIHVPDIRPIDADAHLVLLSLVHFTTKKWIVAYDQALHNNNNDLATEKYADELTCYFDEVCNFAVSAPGYALRLPNFPKCCFCLWCRASGVSIPSVEFIKYLCYGSHAESDPYQYFKVFQQLNDHGKWKRSATLCDMCVHNGLPNYYYDDNNKWRFTCRLGLSFTGEETGRCKLTMMVAAMEDTDCIIDWVQYIDIGWIDTACAATSDAALETMFLGFENTTQTMPKPQQHFGKISTMDIAQRHNSATYSIMHILKFGRVTTSNWYNTLPVMLKNPISPTLLYQQRSFKVKFMSDRAKGVAHVHDLVDDKTMATINKLKFQNQELSTMDANLWMIVSPTLGKQSSFATVTSHANAPRIVSINWISQKLSNQFDNWKKCPNDVKLDKDVTTGDNLSAVVDGDDDVAVAMSDDTTTTTQTATTSSSSQTMRPKRPIQSKELVSDYPNSLVITRNDHLDNQSVHDLYELLRSALNSFCRGESRQRPFEKSQLVISRCYVSLDDNGMPTKTLTCYYSAKYCWACDCEFDIRNFDHAMCFRIPLSTQQAKVAVKCGFACATRVYSANLRTQATMDICQHVTPIIRLCHDICKYLQRQDTSTNDNNEHATVSRDKNNDETSSVGSLSSIRTLSQCTTTENYMSQEVVQPKKRKLNPDIFDDNESDCAAVSDCGSIDTIETVMSSKPTNSQKQPRVNKRLFKKILF